MNFLWRRKKDSSDFTARRSNVATFEDFMKLDIRVGEIMKVEVLEKAKRPAYKLWVDFGEEIGINQSSAQITENYKEDQLVGKQVLGVVNFPSKRILGLKSEVLVLGVYSKQGVILIQPEQAVKNGDKLG